MQLSKGEIQKQAGLKALNLRITGSDLELRDVDYWEVDPSFDGKVFRSAVQAVRPRKQEIINTQLDLPSSPGDRKVCARVVRVNGEQSSILVSKSTGDW